MIRLLTLTLLACLFSIASYAVSPISGTDSVCVGSTRTLTDAATGGTWNSSDTSVASVNLATGVVTGISVGVTTITYTVGTGIATVTFIVNPAAVTIAGASTVSAGSIITITDAITGGAWSSNNTSIATVGATSGIVTGVSPGTVTIYYVTAGGCGTYHIVTVTGSTSAGTISGTASACVGNTSTLTDATAGGLWSSSNTATATVSSSTGVVTAVSAGTCTITYMVGTAIATITFTVNPEAPISGSTTVGVGGTLTLSDAVSGGSWISSNASIATVGSTSGIVTGVAPGTATIYYRTATPCYSYVIVTVTGSTSAGTISGTATACVGNTSTLTDATAGGLWSSSNTAVATVGSSTGVVTAVSAGTCTITYMVGTAIATITFTVNPAATSIYGSTTVVIGGTTTLSDGVSGGAWFSSNNSIATVGSASGVVTGVAAGTVSIYYRTPAFCYTYTIVTVTATSSIHSISGTASACVGNTSTLADSTTGGHWSSSNTAVATVGSTTGVVTAVSAGTCTITYMVGTAIATITFTVNPEAPISGSTTVGTGGTITLTDPVSGGTWLSSNASIAPVGSTSGIVTGIAPGTATIYYRTLAPCYSYIIVTVTASTSAGTISGTASACTGNTSTLTDATIGGHWSSSNTAIATVGSSTGVVTAVSAGICTITYMVGTAIATITFTVNPAATSIYGSTTVGIGGTTTLSDGVSGGAWFSSNNSIATVGSASGVVTGVAAGTVSIYYRTPAFCYTYTIVTVTAMSSIHSISGTTSACVGNTSTLADSTAGGHWSSSNTAVATVGSSTGVVTAVSAGTCTITYMVGTAIVTITFTVNPEAPISGSTTVSTGGTITLSDAVSGGTWITSNASIATVGSTSGIVTGVAPGTATIYYRTATPCYSYVIVTVTGGTSVHAITGTAHACVGTTSTLADSTAGGHWSSSNTAVATVGSSTGVVTAVSAGTCTITYTVGTAIVTITFTVNPEAPISGSTTVSTGGTITLSDAVSGGTWISSNAAVATVGSTSGIVAGLAPGTATIYYRTAAPCYSYIIVTVTASTAVHSIEGAADVCEGSTRTLTDPTTGGHWSSSNTAIATVGSATGVVTGVAAGTCTITYMVGASVVTITFTVNPAAATLSGSSTVSAGSTITLSDAVAGGAWSSNNTSIATVGTASGVVTGVSAGTATIYYVTPGGCYTYHIVTVTPGTPAPEAPAFRLYPNPASITVNLSWQDMQIGGGQVIISDMTGNIVYTAPINISTPSGEVQVPVSGLRNGIYLFDIVNGSVHTSGRISIVR